MKVESIPEKLMRLSEAWTKGRSQARQKGRAMKCKKKCYYKKLCERAGVSFKDDGTGGCARKVYYGANNDKSFMNTSRDREAYYYVAKEAYDAANIGDDDAQDKSQARWHDIKPPYDDESEAKQ